LGLQLPEVYAAQAKAEGKPEGKTTAMLISLLCAVADGKKVFITAHSMGYAQELTRIVGGWADRMGFDSSLIQAPKSFEFWKIGDYRNFGECVRFVDHHAWDDDWERQRTKFNQQMAEARRRLGLPTQKGDV